MTVIIDDYLGRERYQQVEQIIAPTRIVGRMGVFEVKPGMVPLNRLTTIIGLFNTVKYAAPLASVPVFWEDA